MLGFCTIRWMPNRAGSQHWRGTGLSDHKEDTAAFRAAKKFEEAARHDQPPATVTVPKFVEGAAVWLAHC